MVLGLPHKCVPNGREALAAVVRSPPDAVILDLCMADIDSPAPYLEDPLPACAD